MSVTEEEFRWRISCVKLVYADVVSILAGKILASMRETNFSAVFDGD
jgi:hypothetical protein